MKYDGIKDYMLDMDATGILAEKYLAKMTDKDFKGYMPMVGHPSVWRAVSAAFLPAILPNTRAVARPDDAPA